MKQNPKYIKYKKNHKLKLSFYNIMDSKSFIPMKYEYGLQCIESGKILYKHIEACRKSVRRTLKKDGSFFIRIFPFFSVTKKPLAVRMGKGKGNHSYWMAPVKKGQVIFEIMSINHVLSYEALIKAKSKLPLQTKIIKLKF